MKTALFVLTLTSSLFAQAQPDQGGWVPAGSLPPTEQLPAAPYLIAAYAFIWLGVLFYAWTIWHRLGKVEAEIRTLETRRAGR